MFFITKIRAALRLREAIRMADKAHRKTGNRHYVMPTIGSGGRKLFVVDRRNFRLLKQKSYLSRNTRVFDLERECFYYTPYRNGSHAMSQKLQALKRAQYFTWLAADKSH